MKYGKIGVITLLVFIVIITSGIIFILGNSILVNNQQKNTSSLPISTPAKISEINETTNTPKSTPISSMSNEINWRTQTISIHHESERLGKQTFTIELKIPSDWNIQIYPRPTDTNNVTRNCSDYIIASPTREFSMSLRSICSGWGAKYSSWPPNAVIVLQQKRDRHSGPYNRYRVRYKTDQGNYNYVDGESDFNSPLDKNRDQIMDAILIGYAPPN